MDLVRASPISSVELLPMVFLTVLFVRMKGRWRSRDLQVLGYFHDDHGMPPLSMAIGVTVCIDVIFL
jgi:hypothetical protein